jgi:hypothetical protein
MHSLLQLPVFSLASQLLFATLMEIYVTLQMVWLSQAHFLSLEVSLPGSPATTCTKELPTRLQTPARLARSLPFPLK